MTSLFHGKRPVESDGAQAILRLLEQEGELTATAIRERLGLSEKRRYELMRSLREQGLIEVERVQEFRVRLK